MFVVICSVLAIGFFLNAILHLLLIMGFPLGEYVLGGKNVVLPFRMRVVSAFLFVVWTIIGMCYLNYGKVITSQLVTLVDRPLIIGATVFLCFAIFSNGILTTSKKEQRVMTPFSLISFVLSFFVLLYDHFF